MATLLLDRPFGSRRTDAQLQRNAEAFRKLMSGSLQPGELYRTVTGQRPVGPDEQPAVQSWAPSRTQGRTTCKDCNLDLAHGGTPLSSQPARCLPCGRAKRQTHNNAQHLRAKAAVAAVAVGVEDAEPAAPAFEWPKGH